MRSDPRDPLTISELMKAVKVSSTISINRGRPGGGDDRMPMIGQQHPSRQSEPVFLAHPLDAERQTLEILFLQLAP